MPILKLVAPVDGLVAQRNADPGTTVVAGQAVVELSIHRVCGSIRSTRSAPRTCRRTAGARVALRSRSGQQLAGRVLRVEPMADAVTEELLAKVTFETQPEFCRPIGELAESRSICRHFRHPGDSQRCHPESRNSMGVWRIVNGGLQFTPVELGASDLDGLIR